MQIIINGRSTMYRRTGNGKQILVLHGWGDSSAGWEKFNRSLARDYEVITPDLPGFGGSEAPDGAWGLDDYANFVDAFVKKLDLNPFAIVGHSNGGAIAIRGLAQKVLAADKLVLLASAGIRNEYKGRNKALRLLTKTGKVLTSPLPGATKKKLQRKVYQTVGSDMLVAEHLQETFKKVVEDDVRTDAAKLRQPTLLVYGERDTQTPLRYGQLFLEQIPDATLEVLPGAEHFLHQTHEKQVIALVEDFLK